MKKWNFSNLSKITVGETDFSGVDNGIKVKMRQVLLSRLDLESIKAKNGIKTIGTCGIGIIAVDANNELDPLVEEALTNEYNTMDESLHLGRKVLINPYLKKSNGSLSILGVNEQGLFADFISIPEENLTIQLNSMSDDEALFVPYVAVALNIFDSIDSEKGETIVIVSSNAMGLIMAQIARYYQMIPILISSNPDILEKAKELGIYFCHDSKNDDIEKEVLQDTSARMGDYVAYLYDDEYAYQKSLKLLKHGGISVAACVTGIPNAGIKSMSDVIENEIRIVPINNGCKQYTSAINLLATKVVNVEGLIKEHIDSDGIQDAITRFANGDNSLIAVKIK